MKRVGVSSASMSIRETAGWMRWPSASKSGRPSASNSTISPSST